MKSRYQSAHAGQARKRLPLSSPDARQLLHSKLQHRAASRFLTGYLQQVFSLVIQGKLNLRNMRNLFIPAGGWEAVDERHPNFDSLPPREQLRIIGFMS